MKAYEFIHDLSWDDLAEDARAMVRRCLLDTVASAIGGHITDLSTIVRDFAAASYGGQGAHLWLDGREVSAPGAALANGMTVDALDIHDTYLLGKGHAGAALVPAALASVGLRDDGPVTGRELLTTLVVGYEIALRAAQSLHTTACDYHTSGAWNALGCAAIVGRRLGTSEQGIRHALGIAEYHGPRSQMMRCIDHPTMLKDGSGWGAMAGVTAALLADSGFTGAPALTVEGSEVAEIWEDLGRRWLITQQVFKPYAVCYWAQPAIAGALALQETYDISSPDIRRIRVFAFHEATRLTCRRPQNTEQAQYSLPFPMAAALVHGQLGPHELSGPALVDADVLSLSDRVELVEEPLYNERFPAKRYSRVQIETVGGEVYDSGEVQPRWRADDPPSDDELRAKFHWLASSVLGDSRAAALETLIWGCDEVPDMEILSTALAAPPDYPTAGD